MSVTWTPAGEYEDIRYELSGDGIAKITIARPEVRNAFRPETVIELSDAFERAREDTRSARSSSPARAGGVLLGRGPARPRRRRATESAARRAVGRFHVTDLHVQIRRLPKPVVAMVAGYAIGGGHVLHVVCDLTIAADNARFGQTGPRVGSWDGGFGDSVLRDLVGHQEGEGDLAAVPPVRRAGRRWRWGSSTRSCRSTELEDETVGGAARCSPSPPSRCGS